MQKQFLVYKSSAGSGKTYTLVKEYLKIVLLHPGRMYHILAITFTNAAAAEMKSRIIEELGRIKILQDDPEHYSEASHRDAAKARDLLDQMMQEWSKEGRSFPPADALVDNASLVLKKILHNYADFAVSTIDSFVSRIVRTFAFDLGIPMNFDVELDADQMLKQAVDLLVSKVGTNDTLTSILVSYILSQAEEEKNLRIEDMIAEMAKALMEEDGEENLANLQSLSLDDFSVIAGRMKTMLRNYQLHAKKSARNAIQLIEKNDLPVASFSYGKTGIAGYFSKISAGRGEIDVPGNNVIKTIEEDKWYGSKATIDQKAAIDDIKDSLRDLLEEITGKDNQSIHRQKELQAFSRYIFPVALLNEVSRVLEEMKRDKLTLHISDFNKRIAAIVSREPLPFIYERLGEKYRHYMIDEFQDTSALQWQNLLSLIDNALASAHKSLIVGDGKQAIYRFRNGDVEQFARLPQLTDAIQAAARQEWEQTLINNYNEQNLDTNYRSRQEVVGFNNRFFECVREMLPEALRHVYKDTRQKSLAGKPGGYVEISFAEGEKKQDSREETLRQIIDILDRCREAGHPLSDITILCRANGDASLTAAHLMEHNIPVISSESLLLEQSGEVNFILALLGLLTDKHNEVAAAEILGYLYQCGKITNPPEWHACLLEAGLGQSGGNDSPSDLQQSLQSLLNKNNIPLQWSGFAHLNIYDACENIVRIFFASQQEANPFIAFFSDAVYDYTEKNSSSLPDFLEWWEGNSKYFSLIVPAGVEAVQIKTIHKSKGLQFPVVIYPFADDHVRLTKKGQWVNCDLDAFPNLQSSWVGFNKKGLSDTRFEALYQQERDKSQLDLMNLVYVAFTRPVEKLFIISGNVPKKKSDSISGMLVHFLNQQQLWQETQNRYAFGSLERKESVRKTPESRTDFAFARIISEPWSRALRMRSHQAERSLPGKHDDPLERGNLLHRAMEQIRSPEDIEQVLEQLKTNGEIDQTTREEWQHMIGKLISLPELSPYFTSQAIIKPEAGIFDAQGNFFRPDRVVILPGQTAVIDYKTGKEYRKHIKQMETYAALLADMGYPNIKKIILYLDESKVKTV
jgi:ATP-dependent exoDNAse (exonuclease V) beta subunit